MLSHGCNLCSADVQDLCDVEIFGQPRMMRRCVACGYTFFEEVSWIAAAYKESYTKADVRWIGRSVWGARLTNLVARLYFPICKRDRLKVFELGAGYGLTAALLSDLGYKVLAQDRYSSVKLYDNFIEEIDCADFDIIYAYEVLEHVPHHEVRSVIELVKSARISIFSTEVPPSSPDELLVWKYLGLEHGQHISFFSVGAMKEIARKCDKKYITDGKWIHIFVDKKFIHFPISLIKVLLRFRLCFDPWKV